VYIYQNAMCVYVLSDLDLPLRGRTYREPDEPHVAVVKGRDIDVALDHLDLHPECRALAVLGAPAEPPDLELLAGRRLFVAEAEGAHLWAMVEVGLRAGADVEWYRGDPPLGVLAAWALPVGAVVLAAGSGSRMGTDKLLLAMGGRPMVRHVIEAASEGGSHTVHAVYASDEVRRAIAGAAVPVHNPRARSGQASSLQVGLQSMPEEVAAAVVLLGDQPLVGARTVRRLLRVWREEDSRPAVAAAFDEAEGWRPPVVLHRALWPDLFDLGGDEGARQLFKSKPELLATVPANGRADDVDTPEDYARVVKLFPRPS
jgi:molybdenum cofactor cytidylyltransferase